MRLAAWNVPRLQRSSKGTTRPRSDNLPACPPARLRRVSCSTRHARMRRSRSWRVPREHLDSRVPRRSMRDRTEAQFVRASSPVRVAPDHQRSRAVDHRHAGRPVGRGEREERREAPGILPAPPAFQQGVRRFGVAAGCPTHRHWPSRRLLDLPQFRANPMPRKTGAARVSSLVAGCRILTAPVRRLRAP